MQLPVHRARRLGRQPGHGLELLLRGGEEPVGRAEVPQDRAAVATGRCRRACRRSTRTRACRASGGGSVIANRCASSRIRCSSCRPGSCRSSRIGCERPGTNTSSSRFASAITATRGSPCRRLHRLERRRQLPLATVDHDEVRHRREALVVPARSPASRKPCEAAGDHLPHRGEVVLAVEPLDRERPVVRPFSAARRRTPSSRRRCRGPAGSRCRSTRSGPAGSRG